MDIDRLRLMLVSDGGAREDLARIVEDALCGGVTAVQLREKSLGARELLEFARPLRRLTREHGAWLIVNDRIDVALAVGADAVQLGWRSLPIGEARAIVGSDLAIGVSTHSAQEARQAGRDGADYVTFGPVFDTPSKDGLVETQGLARLAECARDAGLPVVAIGGVTPARARDIWQTGAAGIAAIRGLIDAPSPADAARDYEG